MFSYIGDVDWHCEYKHIVLIGLLLQGTQPQGFSSLCPIVIIALWDILLASSSQVSYHHDNTNIDHRKSTLARGSRWEFLPKLVL